MSCSRTRCQHTHQDRPAIWSRLRFPGGVVSLWTGGESGSTVSKKMKNTPWCFVPRLGWPAKSIQVRLWIHHISWVHFSHQLYCKKWANSDRLILLISNWLKKWKLHSLCCLGCTWMNCSICLSHQKMWSSEASFVRGNTVNFGFETLPPRLPPFWPEVAFKFGALSDPIWDSRTNTLSLLAFTCWQQWLHLEVMIGAVLNGQTQSVQRPLLKGSIMHYNYWPWTLFALLCLQITIKEVYFGGPFSTHILLIMRVWLIVISTAFQFDYVIVKSALSSG